MFLFFITKNTSYTSMRNMYPNINIYYNIIMLQQQNEYFVEMQFIFSIFFYYFFNKNITDVSKHQNASTWLRKISFHLVVHVSRKIKSQAWQKQKTQYKQVNCHLHPRRRPMDRETHGHASS